MNRNTLTTAMFALVALFASLLTATTVEAQETDGYRQARPDEVFYTAKGNFTLHQAYLEGMLNQNLQLPNGSRIQLFPFGNPDFSRRTSSWATDMFVDIVDGRHVFLITNRNVWILVADGRQFENIKMDIEGGKIHKVDNTNGVYLVSKSNDSGEEITGVLYLETEYGGEDWKFAKYTGSVRRTMVGAQIKVSVARGITIVAEDKNNSVDGMVIHNGYLVPIKTCDF